MRLPPSPPLPRLAQTALWGMAPLQLMRECRRRYGETFCIRTVGVAGDIVLVSSPEAIRQVWSGDPDVLHAGEANAAVLVNFVGPRSLLVLDGKAHLRERKLLMPPFHGERMLAYAAAMRAAAEESVARWPVGRPFAVLPHLRDIALEVILRAVFGLEEGARQGSLHRVIARLLDDAASPWRLLPVLLGLDLFKLLPNHPLSRLKAQMDRAIFALIAERRGAVGGTDVLSLLLSARDEEGRGLSDEDLRDELVTLLVAGHETTATATAWTLQCLLAEPAAMERARADVAAGGHAVVDAAIKEALRLRPVVSIVARKLKAPMRIAGWDLPAGVTVAPCIYLAHRNPEIYPEPERFRLERFLDGKPDLGAWLPFGGGVRRCIGMSFALMEMRVVLETVLRRARLSLPPEGPAVPARRGITLAPSGGSRVVRAA